MEYDTKQQPAKKKKKEPVKRKIVDVGHSAISFDTANYCSCLERVKDYSKIKDLVITFIELRNEDLPEPLYDTKGLEWQIWRKNYGEVVKYYWYNNLLDIKVRILDNDTEPAPDGFTRLYRALPAKDLPRLPQPKKAKSFVKKAPALENEKNETIKH